MYRGRDLSTLPNPLVFEDGTAVKSKEDWGRRRQELLELFRTHVYGRAPEAAEAEACAVVVQKRVSIALEGAAERHEVTLRVPGPSGEVSIYVLAYIPTGPGPHPAFLLINSRISETGLAPDFAIQSRFWPAAEIVSRGYAAVTFNSSNVALDGPDCFQHGVYSAFPEAQSNDSWGALGAWAWGASRVMDYLGREPSIDATRVGVVGHSRGGKASLWCGAQDERFAMVVSNNSGCAGAALARGSKGEKIENITGAFPFWFCRNYGRYAGREHKLPVDQHELLALVAPRLLYVTSATEDSWCDPEGQLAACIAASPVCELLDVTGLRADGGLEVAQGAVQPDKPLKSGNIAYHTRTGGHDLTPWDWSMFMDYADAKMRG